ncbi:hypothetical protein BDA99DRAFT_540872 [Phascolomyces articulosus]|uniref:F-box domain-containing protein n=1 Tax=Phascolomyces articulosus TaxID=60185 RepID=A0AAD5JTA4_9FUNG|nr:hypothetical protein BDA99DRAFT_540872 [Phascolomyces articulosus]
MTIQPVFDSITWACNSRTNLDFIPIINEFEKGKQAYAAHDYECAIEAYTRALNLHTEITSVILLQRAIARNKHHQINLALADYSSGYNINSHVNSNYPLKGTTGTCSTNTDNMLSNQERLKQKALMYLEGANDDSLGEAFQETLVQQFMDIMDKLDFHNQWLFRHLSYDIIIRILSYLPFWKDRGQLSLTCRFWNKFITKDWGKMWETIDYSSISEHENNHYNWDPRVLQPMPMGEDATRSFMDCVVPDQVRNIKLDFKTDYGDRSRILSSKVLNLKLDKVESLDIVLENNSVLSRVLSMGKYTMKSVTLRYQLVQWERFDYYEDALSTSVQMCPNINTITLHVEGYHFDDQQTSNQPIQPIIPSSKLCLDALTLYCYPTTITITRGLMAQLLDEATVLTFLKIKSVSFHIEILETVLQHFPTLLQELVYADHAEHIGFVTRHTMNDDSRNKKCSVKPTIPGLKSLCLSFTHRRVHQNTHTFMGLDQIIGKILKTHHNTLQELNIVWNPIFLKDHISFIMLANHGAPQLRTLKLCIDARDNSEKFCHAKVIAMLIDGCRALESVQLSSLCFMDKQVYCSLGRLKRLEHLCIEIQKLEDTHSDNDDNNNGLVLQMDGMELLFQDTPGLQHLRIIQHHNAKLFRKNSLLSELAVDKLSIYIGTCQTLREIDFSNFIFSNNQLIILLKCIKKNPPPKVTKLMVKVPENGIHERELKALASVGGIGMLQSLIIHDNRHCFKGLSEFLQIFEEYQGLKPFLVQVKLENSGHISGFCKERLSLKDLQGINCPYKKYNITSSRYLDKNYRQIYCTECTRHHPVYNGEERPGDN